MEIGPTFPWSAIRKPCCRSVKLAQLMIDEQQIISRHRVDDWRQRIGGDAKVERAGDIHAVTDDSQIAKGRHRAVTDCTGDGHAVYLSKHGLPQK